MSPDLVADRCGASSHWSCCLGGVGENLGDANGLWLFMKGNIKYGLRLAVWSVVLHFIMIMYRAEEVVRVMCLV